MGHGVRDHSQVVILTQKSSDRDEDYVICDVVRGPVHDHQIPCGIEASQKGHLVKRDKQDTE
ncbi:MAG: hypothetical protein MjAS7_2066 [Metallosphaera javensis (ex Sakai et al. 2022)]|nr:MAG: hypothetical protein MjAS7_2066 [Metallosphaera javensis (ex Sakai et al. 2022)]